jgi:hypothetical protein
MKNKLIKRFLIIVAITVSLAMSAASAFAITNSTSVVSPFWQSDGSVYTFVAVSHSSLQAMNSQIGVVMSAIKTDGSSFGTTEFTVTNNSTSRVFIVATNHSTINNLTITAAGNLFIAGTTNLASGHLAVTPRATAPLDRAYGGIAARHRDITMLTFWGSVVIPGTNTGFAMEFIGDTHDSIFAADTNLQNVAGHNVMVGVN